MRGIIAALSGQLRTLRRRTGKGLPPILVEWPEAETRSEIKPISPVPIDALPPPARDREEVKSPARGEEEKRPVAPPQPRPRLLDTRWNRWLLGMDQPDFFDDRSGRGLGGSAKPFKN